MPNHLPFDPSEVQAYRRSWGLMEYSIAALMVLIALMGLAVIHLNVSDYLDQQLDSIEQSHAE
jgi:hypothetical protein